MGDEQCELGVVFVRQDAEGWANSWAREVGKVGAGRGFGRGDGPIIKAENPDRARNAIVVRCRTITT